MNIEDKIEKSVSLFKEGIIVRNLLLLLLPKIMDLPVNRL